MPTPPSQSQITDFMWMWYKLPQSDSLGVGLWTPLPSSGNKFSHHFSLIEGQKNLFAALLSYLAFTWHNLIAHMLSWHLSLCHQPMSFKTALLPTRPVLGSEIRWHDSDTRCLFLCLDSFFFLIKDFLEMKSSAIATWIRPFLPMLITLLEAQMMWSMKWSSSKTVYWTIFSGAGPIIVWSESRSVMSDSLQPQGIFQARILEWAAFPFSRVIVRSNEIKIEPK